MKELQYAGFWVGLRLALFRVGCQPIGKTKKYDAAAVSPTTPFNEETSPTRYIEPPPAEDRPAPQHSEGHYTPIENTTPHHDVPAPQNEEETQATPSAAIAAPTEKPESHKLECVESYQEKNPDWFPGLPSAPSTQPLFTDYQPAADGSRFTDARQDALMAFVADRANALPAEMQKSSQEFAKRIQDVQVLTVGQGAGSVRVKIQYTYDGKSGLIDLRGQLQTRHKSQQQATLVQVPIAGRRASAMPFAGLLTCADLDQGCQSVVLRLDEKKAGKIIRSAFIIHRWGDARLTLSDQDRNGFARLQNPGYSAFAEFISNSLNNSCLSQLNDVHAGRLRLSACALQSLQKECGSEDIKKPSARDISLRSWAVAYGRAAFELSLTSAPGQGIGKFDHRLGGNVVFAGPLVYSAKPPASSEALRLYGALATIQKVYLVNNDGGGNLNLQIDFSGSPEAHMRLSVTSSLPNTQSARSVQDSVQ